MGPPGWRAWMMGATSNAAGAASASSPPSQAITLLSPSFLYMFSNPPANPSILTGVGTSLFDYVLSFNMVTDLAKIYATGNGFADSPWAQYTAPNPTDLSALRNRGGKVLVYHGTADPIWYLNDTLNWYAGVTTRQNGDATDFVRVFTV